MSDLQSGVAVNSTTHVVSGTSAYVDGYTGFSENEDLQEGNFIALHFSAVSGATITAEIIGDPTAAVVTETSGVYVFRVSDPSQYVRVTATKAEVGTDTEIYPLSGLTLTPET